MSMKVTFPSVDLLKVLKDIDRVGTGKTDMLRNILIQANPDEDRVDFTASSESISLKRTLYQRFGEHTTNIRESGSVLVPAHKLLKFVQFADSNVTFEQENLNLRVRFGDSDVKILGQETEKFTLYQNKEETNRVELSAPVLRRVLNRVVYAHAKSITRPEITGVNFTIADGTMSAIATDSMRFAKTSAGNVILEGVDARTLTIPGEPLKHLSAMLPKDEDDLVVLDIGERVMVASWGDDENCLTMRALEGAFPDCNRIIPSSTKATLKVNREGLLRTVEMISIVAENVDQQRCIFAVQDGQLIVSGESQETGKAAKAVSLLNPGVTIEKMGFNASYWTEALKSLDSETIEIGITGALKPVIITNGEDNTVAVISPVRLAASSEEQKSA